MWGNWICNILFILIFSPYLLSESYVQVCLCRDTFEWFLSRRFNKRWSIIQNKILEYLLNCKFFKNLVNKKRNSIIKYTYRIGFSKRLWLVMFLQWFKWIFINENIVLLCCCWKSSHFSLGHLFGSFSKIWAFSWQQCWWISWNTLLRINT